MQGGWGQSRARRGIDAPWVQAWGRMHHTEQTIFFCFGLVLVLFCMLRVHRAAFLT